MCSAKKRCEGRINDCGVGAEEGHRVGKGGLFLISSGIGGGNFAREFGFKG